LHLCEAHTLHRSSAASDKRPRLAWKQHEVTNLFAQVICPHFKFCRDCDTGRRLDRRCWDLRPAQRIRLMRRPIQPGRKPILQTFPSSIVGLWGTSMPSHPPTISSHHRPPTTKSHLPPWRFLPADIDDFMFFDKGTFGEGAAGEAVSPASPSQPGQLSASSASSQPARPAIGFAPSLRCAALGCGRVYVCISQPWAQPTLKAESNMAATIWLKQTCNRAIWLSPVPSQGAI